MISDRISLNLAYLYLKKIQVNGGTISGIQFSIRAHNTSNSNLKTLTPFNSLNHLKTWIEENAPLTTFKNINCMNLNLYELKGFNIKKVNTLWPIASNERTWSGIQYEAITPILVQDYLIGGIDAEGKRYGYTKNFNELERRFDELQYNEYILSQLEYIDCGYIEVYFEEDLVNLKELYTKYK